MESKLVCAASYLSYEEGVLLYNELQEVGIQALVKSCGPPSIPFGEGLYFQLLVPEETFAIASEITEGFKNKIATALKIQKCPKCRSEAVSKVKSLPFWKKIYYAGTEVYSCENCGNNFAR